MEKRRRVKGRWEEEERAEVMGREGLNGGVVKDAGQGDEEWAKVPFRLGWKEMGSSMYSI